MCSTSAFRLPRWRRASMISFCASVNRWWLRARMAKTTTTSMLAWIYEVAARRRPEVAPRFLIGGVAENFHTSFQLRATRPFVIEGDEYDTAFFDKGPKFMHYFPGADSDARGV